MGADAIDSLALNQSLYTFSKANGMLFVLRTDKDATKGEIPRRLEKIKLIFFNHYPAEKYVENWFVSELAWKPVEKTKYGQIVYNLDGYKALAAEYESFFSDSPDQSQKFLRN
ncbi:MAG: hypothetical protein RBG13Loki_0776 [Promethearchaeota archaeon CR_4]|nr:MAG: hypothetical protein RBG13Loki_0776 [Candidatus Lokiarchaeota archaeon CR_4]